MNFGFLQERKRKRKMKNLKVQKASFYFKLDRNKLYFFAEIFLEDFENLTINLFETNYKDLRFKNLREEIYWHLRERERKHMV